MVVNWALQSLDRHRTPKALDDEALQLLDQDFVVVNWALQLLDRHRTPKALEDEALQLLDRNRTPKALDKSIPSRLPIRESVPYV